MKWWAAVLTAGLLVACGGGQTGQPTEGGGSDCVYENVAIETTDVVTTPLGQRLESFYGTYAAPLAWLEPGPSDPCPRPRSETSQLALDLRPNGRAQLVRCTREGGAEHSYYRLGVAAKARTADGGVSRSFDSWLRQSDLSDEVWLHDGVNREIPGRFSVGATLAQRDGQRSMTGYIQTSDRVGAFPSSCPGLCEAEPSLSSVESPLSLERVRTLLEQTAFSGEGVSGALRLQALIEPQTPAVCVMPRTTVYGTLPGAAYQLPVQVRVLPNVFRKLEDLPFFLRVSGGEGCAECTRITTSVAGTLDDPSSPLWPGDAIAGEFNPDPIPVVHVQVDFQLDVPASGAPTGSARVRLHYQTQQGEGERELWLSASGADPSRLR